MVALAGGLMTEITTNTQASAAAASDLPVTEIIGRNDTSHDAGSYDASSHEIKVMGDVDIATAPSLHQQLTTALVDPAGSVVVDLRDVTFIDSTGLGVLVNARQRARATGVAFDLRLPKGPARFPFVVTGLVSLFEAKE